MKASLVHCANEELRVRSFKDRRCLVNRLTLSYIGDDGHEYRRSFEHPTSTPYSTMMDQAPQTIEIHKH